MKKQFIITSRRDRPCFSVENYVATVTAKNRELALSSLLGEGDCWVDLRTDNFALLQQKLYHDRYHGNRFDLEKAMFEHRFLPEGVSLIRIAEMTEPDAHYENLALWVR